MNTPNTYSINVKPNSTGRKVITWTRYAFSQQDAEASAQKAVDETYFGEGSVVSVSLVRQEHVSN